MKKLCLRSGMIFFFSFFMLFSNSYYVKADDIGGFDGNQKVIDYNVLNEYSDTIQFTGDNFAIVKGSFVNKLLLPYVIGQINVEGLINDYEIEEVKVFDGDTFLNDSDVVINGMKLVFDNDNIYDIIVVGDMNDDAIVNDDDVSIMFEKLLDGSEIGPLNDVNNDGVFNNLDITYTIYSIKNSSWVSDEIINDVLVSDFFVGKDVIYVNDEFEISYLISGFEEDFINGFEGILGYDSDVLKYIGYEIDSKYRAFYSDRKFGFILDNYGDTEEISKQIILKFKFKAIKEGNTKVEINNILASMNGMIVNLDKNLVSADITINNYGTGGDGKEDNFGGSDVSNDKVIDNVVVDSSVATNLVVKSVIRDAIVNSVDESNNNNIIATVVSLSSDSFINSLEIEDYEIDFKKEKYNYNISVPYDVKSLNFKIVLSDSDASYEILGNKNFKVGNNAVSIVVTALDGSTTTYTVNVTREKEIEKENVEEKTSNSSRVVIIILIILVIIGLVYVIFKDDQEDAN